MNSRLRYIFTRCIIIGMAVFVCLPCTARRAFKQALDIRVATVAPEDKANQAQNCPVIGEWAARQTVAGEQEFYPQNSDAGLNNTIPFIPIPTVQAFVPVQMVVTVPLYILHRQYLI